MNSAEPGGERRRQARAGRGAGAPAAGRGRASPARSPARPSALVPASRPLGKLREEGAGHVPGRPGGSRAGSAACCARPPAPARARLGAPGSRPWSAGPSSARPRAGAPLSPGRGGSPKPPTLVKREHGDLRLGRSLCKKVLEPAVQGSSPEREVTGTLREVAHVLSDMHLWLRPGKE